ncbi:hypothetical protein EBZ70_01905 [bacterium]|jgi:hypothetical protein|nr:hypothetical protein [bacterium]
MKQVESTIEWSCAGWSEHGVLRREIARTMSFADRLKWLESANRAARLLRAAPVVEPPPFARRDKPPGFVPS